MVYLSKDEYLSFNINHKASAYDTHYSRSVDLIDSIVDGILESEWDNLIDKEKNYVKKAISELIYFRDLNGDISLQTRAKSGSTIKLGTYSYSESSSETGSLNTADDINLLLPSSVFRYLVLSSLIWKRNNV